MPSWPAARRSPVADERWELGLRGEKLAERFLRRRGMSVIARRYNTPAGEIDLIMKAGDTIVFVEVKTRRDDRMSDPEDAVNADKRRKMARCARCFVNERRLHQRPCRFDVVSVILPADGKSIVKHIPEAFMPDRW